MRRFVFIALLVIVLPSSAMASAPLSAETLFRQGKWDKAAAEYARAVEQDPSLKNIHRLAESYLYSFNYSYAEKAFKKALALDKDDDYAVISLAMIDAITSRSNRALKKLVEMGEEYGGDPRYWRALGLAHFKRKLDRDAIEIFQEAVNRNPRDYMSYFFIGLIYEEHLDFDNAIKPYKMAVEINPDFAQAVNNLGYNYKERHYFSYAREMYERAIELNPENAGYYYNIGNVFNHWSMRREAFYLYRKAVEYDPAFAKAHYNYGKNLIRFGFLEEGIENLELYIKYWSPNLSERDVPHPDEVKDMIRDVKYVIEDRKEEARRIEAERRRLEEEAERLKGAGRNDDSQN